jgi:hypothetical protein
MRRIAIVTATLLLSAVCLAQTTTVDIPLSSEAQKEISAKVTKVLPSIIAPFHNKCHLLNIFVIIVPNPEMHITVLASCDDEDVKTTPQGANTARQ